MTDDEYELLPHQLLADLKYDVEALKKKLNEPETKTNELILEIESLKDSIHDLNSIFQKALAETRGEDIVKTVQKLNENINEVVNQNETIAKGMIAISDKLEHFMEQQPKKPSGQQNQRPSQPVQHTMGPPAMPGARVAPQPQLTTLFSPENKNDQGLFDTDLPPPPQRKILSGKKKSLAGMFG